MAKVSVCIPTFNNLELFKKCLDSVLMQDYTDYEVIVSDDSDGNDIENHILSIGNHKIKYYHNKVLLGSPENWNNSIRKSSGDYIKVLHHDDYFNTPDSLGKFVKALDDNRDASFVFCWSRVHFAADNSIYINVQTEGQIKRMRDDLSFLFFRNVIGAPSATLFKRDVAIEFNRNYKWLVDVEFYINYLNKHVGFVSIPEALVTVVAGEEGQITESIAKDKDVVLAENINLFSAIFTRALHTHKTILYFQELFDNYDIVSIDQLRSCFKVPANLNLFLHDVFFDKPKQKLLKLIKKRLLTSRYNKRIFKIERF